MASFFELVETLQGQIDLLSDLLSGDENTTVEINGETRSSIQKSITDNFIALQSMVQGRLSYESKSAMDAAGAPPASELAEVWDDPTSGNNGLYGYKGGVWVKSNLDTLVQFSVNIDSGDAGVIKKLADSYMKDSRRRVPLSPSDLDNNIVHAVVSDGVILGYYDSKGKFHSDHEHDEIKSLEKTMDVLKYQAPLNEQDIVHAIVSDGVILGYYDSKGKFHSDHDHGEFNLINSLIAGLQEEIDKLKATTKGTNVGYLAHEQDVNGEKQIFVHDTEKYRKLTLTGANWLAPLIHSYNVIRCLSDYSTGDLQPHTLLPSGKIIAEDSVIYQQLVTGQSLSLGSRGYILNPDGEYVFSAPNGIGDLFTNECPDDLKEHCLMLNNGIRHAGTYFVPTKELPNGVLGETVCSSYMISLAYGLQNESNGMLPRLVSAISGIGGVPYDSLKKGTSAYSGALARTNEIAAAAQAKGWKHVVNQIRIIHGESQGVTTEAEYAAILREWVSDYQADISAITNQPNPPVGVLCQMNTQGTANREVPLAQLKAANDNDDIILLGPKYQYPYWDSAHMLAEGYVKTGELEAKAMGFWLAKKKWEPLKPVSCYLNGNVVVIEFNNELTGDLDNIPGPIGNLEFDIEHIKETDDYGFVCTDGTVIVTDVRVGLNGTSVEITFDAPPALGSKITYALQEGFAQTSNGPRGNLRDNDTRTVSRFDEKYVHNWCVAFSTLIN
ncbi:hypothetical protein P4S60_09190 [Pseudoalteromonas sp. Hal040]|uniref:hypothetical protein n=1 Tax=unclassified Pseudoalteromonas TaxID=194690 RepID=UPI00301DDC5D